MEKPPFRSFERIEANLQTVLVQTYRPIHNKVYRMTVGLYETIFGPEKADLVSKIEVPHRQLTFPGSRRQMMTQQSKKEALPIRNTGLSPMSRRN
jgi:hypothetical protein